MEAAPSTAPPRKDASLATELAPTRERPQPSSAPRTARVVRAPDRRARIARLVIAVRNTDTVGRRRCIAGRDVILSLEVAAVLRPLLLLRFLPLLLPGRLRLRRNQLVPSVLQAWLPTVASDRPLVHRLPSVPLRQASHVPAPRHPMATRLRVLRLTAPRHAHHLYILHTLARLRALIRWLCLTPVCRLAQLPARL